VAGDSGNEIPTIWKGTTPTALGLLTGSVGAAAVAINDRGVVAGTSFVGGERATVWHGTTPTALGMLPGMTESDGASINNAGQVVGWSGILVQGSLFPLVATIWNGTTPTNLNSVLDSSGAGWDLTIADGINSKGQIVGTGVYRGAGDVSFLLTPVGPAGAVPSPTIGAGLPGLIIASGGLLVWWHRKRRTQAASQWLG
jgi:hypothetical protein